MFADDEKQQRATDEALDAAAEAAADAAEKAVDAARKAADAVEEAIDGASEAAAQAGDPSGEPGETWETPEEAARRTIRELEAQLTDAKDMHLRLLAEFDNFKRRTARERIELRETATQDLMVDLLAVLDDFDRARTALEESQGKQLDAEGFELIASKFRRILESKGLEGMDSLGKDFDPEWHEAITEIPAPNKKQKGKVVDVIERGYRLGEKIIRYAKVVVGK